MSVVTGSPFATEPGRGFIAPAQPKEERVFKYFRILTMFADALEAVAAAEEDQRLPGSERGNEAERKVRQNWSQIATLNPKLEQLGVDACAEGANILASLGSYVNEHGKKIKAAAN